MKPKLFLLLFLPVILIPNLFFAQFTQQGPKLFGSGAIGPSTQGWSVAISSDGNTAIIGGNTDNGASESGWVNARISELRG